MGNCVTSRLSVTHDGAANEEFYMAYGANTKALEKIITIGLGAGMIALTAGALTEVVVPAEIAAEAAAEAGAAAAAGGAEAGLAAAAGDEGIEMAPLAAEILAGEEVPLLPPQFANAAAAAGEEAAERAGVPLAIRKEVLKKLFADLWAMWSTNAPLANFLKKIVDPKEQQIFKDMRDACILTRTAQLKSLRASLSDNGWQYLDKVGTQCFSNKKTLSLNMRVYMLKVVKMKDDEAGFMQIEHADKSCFTGATGGSTFRYYTHNFDFKAGLGSLNP